MYSSRAHMHPPLPHPAPAPPHLHQRVAEGVQVALAHNSLNDAGDKLAPGVLDRVDFAQAEAVAGHGPIRPGDLRRRRHRSKEWEGQAPSSGAQAVRGTARLAAA
jgi:hypothetical protein